MNLDEDKLFGYYSNACGENKEKGLFCPGRGEQQDRSFLFASPSTGGGLAAPEDETKGGSFLEKNKGCGEDGGSQTHLQRCPQDEKEKEGFFRPGRGKQQVCSFPSAFSFRLSPPSCHYVVHPALVVCYLGHHVGWVVRMSWIRCRHPQNFVLLFTFTCVGN